MKTIAQLLKHDFKSKGSLYLYDTDGKEIYFEDSDGDWCKQEFDVNGNEIYFERSYGDWCKQEFDVNGNEIHHENSNRYWVKRDYDSNGNIIYLENSTGYIVDNRPKTSCNGKVVEIDGKKYKLTEL